MIVKLILLMVIGILIPYLVGTGCTYFYKEKKDSVILSLVSGYVLIWGIFQVLVLPAIYLKWSLDRFCYLFGGIVVVLCALSLVLNRMRTIGLVKNAVGNLFRSSWILWVAGILILLQAGYVSQYQHIDDDDAFYVATAESAVSTNTLMEINPYTGGKYSSMPARYVLSPFPVYVAVMSQFLDVKPVTMAHMLYPALLLPLAYCVYYLLAGHFFTKSETKGIFLVLLQMVMMFSGYSGYTQGMFLAVRSWQGKAVLAAILIPTVFYYVIRMWEKQSWMDYVMLLLLMLACCMVSSMGIMLGAITLGLLSLVYLWEEKKIRPVLLMWLCCVPNAVCAAIYIMIR